MGPLVSEQRIISHESSVTYYFDRAVVIIIQPNAHWAGKGVLDNSAATNDRRPRTHRPTDHKPMSDV